MCLLLLFLATDVVFSRAHVKMFGWPVFLFLKKGIFQIYNFCLNNHRGLLHNIQVYLRDNVLYLSKYIGEEEKESDSRAEFSQMFMADVFASL